MQVDVPRELTLTVHYRTDVGSVRDHNEDYLGYREPEEPKRLAEYGRLYAVADGVAGAQAGEVASKLAVQMLLAAYYRSRGETQSDRLREAFAETNRAIHERAAQQGVSRRMSTTLVAAAIRGEELTVASVGDSRAYLVRDGEIRQITRDHSLVAQMVAEGILTPEQAQAHPRRHVLSRSMGTRPDVEVDLFAETLAPGDRLLLCSDGVTEYLSDAEILSVVRDQDPESAVQRLVDLANERGGQDNITVLVVRALLERRAPASPRTRPARVEEVERAPVVRQRTWSMVGVLVVILIGCAAGLMAGNYLWRRRIPTRVPAIDPEEMLTITPSETVTPTAVPTATEIVTATFTPRLTPTGTLSETWTPTVVPTATETATATSTPTSPSGQSPLPTPTGVFGQSPLPTPTSATGPSPLPTPTPTSTSTSAG